MDRLKALKSIASGEKIEKGASLTDVMDIGMTVSKLNKMLHTQAEPQADRPPAKVQTGLLQQLKALISKAEAPEGDSADTYQFSSTPVIGEKIAKSIDTDKGLITAVVLRPDVTDLHGDIYDCAEVEKACFNFNTRCRKTNIQHEQMADFDIVESFIAKSDFQLGEGMVLKGDWVATMHIDPKKHEDVWKAVKDDQFTGFSIGCKANVEVIA